MFGVKGVAKALKEVVEMGGRITEESAEFLDKLLSDELDDIQENAREIVDDVTSMIEEKLADLADRLEELESAKAPAKKAVTK